MTSICFFAVNIRIYVCHWINESGGELCAMHAGGHFGHWSGDAMFFYLAAVGLVPWVKRTARRVTRVTPVPGDLCASHSLVAWNGTKGASRLPLFFCRRVSPTNVLPERTTIARDRERKGAPVSGCTTMYVLGAAILRWRVAHMLLLLLLLVALVRLLPILPPQQTR